MLQNAYLLAKIDADTAENEQHFAEILPISRRVTDRLHPGALTAGIRSAIGRAAARRDMIVRTPYKFDSVMFSPWGLLIAFLATIPRYADDTFDNIAEPNASHVNDNSFRLARPTPPTIGMRVKYTGRL